MTAAGSERTRAAILGAISISALSACASEYPPDPSGPDVSCSMCTPGYAPGEPIELVAGWDHCRKDPHSADPDWVCETLPFEIDIQCSGIDCSWQRTGPTAFRYQVLPSGTGEITLRVVLARSDTGEEYVWEGGPYLVAAPDRYVATCVRTGGLPCTSPAPRDVGGHIEVAAWSGNASLTFTLGVETNADAALGFEYDGGAVPPASTYSQVVVFSFRNVLEDNASAIVRHGDWAREFAFALE